MDSMHCIKPAIISLLLLQLALYSLPGNTADVLIPSNQILEIARGKYYLISIGVNNYQDAFWPTLKWPASDATRVADQLGKATVSRVEKTLLLNEYATYDSVTNALNQVAKKVSENDTVVLYISGHGTLAQNASGELERIVVLHDTSQSRLLTTGLKHSLLNDWMEHLRAHKKMMIFATCHSGEGKSRLPENVQALIRTNKGVLPPLSDVSEGALVLAAAAKGEAARENDDLQGDIYTHYLLEALTVYDRNRDGMVSALEAHDYARERTWAFTRGQQRPTANMKQIGDADIPLYGKKISTGLPVLEAYDDSLAGFFVKVDDGVKGRLPLAFPLNPESSVVSFYSPGSDSPLKRYKVNATKGETLSLTDVMTDRPIVMGVQFRRFNWSDQTWDELTGSSDVTVTEFNLGYQWKHYTLGMAISIPADGSNIIRDPIESKTELKSQLLTAGYIYKQRQLTFIGRLELGREELALRLHDLSVNESLDYTDTAFAKGVSFIMGYNVVADFSMTIEAGIRDTDWHFNRIGDLSGRRRSISLGMNYQFGTKARTLW